MKLQLLNEDLTTRIQHLLNKYYHGNPTKQELLQTLAQLDPTPNYQYLEWIIKHHKTGNIRIPEDNEKIRKQLQQFHILKNKQTFKQKHQTDINKYTPSTLYNTLNDYEGQGQESNRQAKSKARHGKLTLPPGSKLILDTGEYQVVKITGAKASETLCSGTNWCTANPAKASDYLDEGPLYLIYVDGKRSYLVHYETNQFKYPDDREVSDETKLELIGLLSPATGKDQYYCPKLAYWYLTAVDGNDEKALNIIKKSPEQAVLYVVIYLKGRRWPEAEPYIAKSPIHAIDYVSAALNGERWPEAEPYIMEEPEWAYWYAAEILHKQRWPEAEPYIMTDPYWAWMYTQRVLGEERWPEAEQYLMKEPMTAYNYARYVLKRPWPEAEPYIMKDHYYAWAYARFVLRRRWPEAENIIINSPSGGYYLNYFM